MFEEDWALCAPDSGCPSESMLEDECFADRSMASQSHAGLPQSSQDHLVLEWDPSVDIGGSHDDMDSSSFSAAAGRIPMSFFFIHYLQPYLENYCMVKCIS